MSTSIPPLAYLVSYYPALSHTFIDREVRALRDLGVDLETWSVRPALTADLMAEQDREAARSTRTILGRGLLPVLTAHAVVLLAAPRAYVRTLLGELQSSRPGLRARVWQLFYFAEAVVLHAALRRSGRRHVHVHLTNNASDIARAAVRLGRARGDEGWSWSLTVHGSSEFADVLGTDLAAKVEDALMVVCISDFAKSQLMALVGVEHWDKFAVVHCGVEAERYPSLAGQREGRSGPLRILNVGRLVPVKGLGVLFQALADYLRGGGDAELALVGRGPAEDGLKELAARLEIADKVHFVGAVGQDDILEWYEWADLMCMSSFAEGIPVVLMEAMATGLPVVSTRITGIPELIVDGQSGHLVPPARADALVDAWRRCEDPSVRRRMGEAGRQTVLAGFEVRKNARELCQHFDRVLGAGVTGQASSAPLL